jgi:transposase-like protein
MECPKCNKDTCVLVTTQNKKSVQQTHGLFWRIITWPFRMIGRLFQFLFLGKREKYHETQHWHCNYCGADYKPEEMEKIVAKSQE